MRLTEYMGLKEKSATAAFHLVTNWHDFSGMHDLSGNFSYDDFFRKTHAPLYTGQWCCDIFIY